MITLKQILLPTDGSACSQQALRYALALAQQFDAHVLALHVTHSLCSQANADTAIPVVHKLQQEEAANADRIQQEVAEAARAASVRCEITLVPGSAADVILRLAKEKAADLIVMGTHGRTGLQHALLGSVAEKTVRRAPCPVLIVRQTEHEFVTESICDEQAIADASV